MPGARPARGSRATPAGPADRWLRLIGGLVLFGVAIGLLARARLGVPNPMEVATTAVFLASPLSSRTTGQAVSVNGGISAA